MEQVKEIVRFVVESFVHVWPYLVVTIPLAVFVKLSNFSKYINSALNRSPLVSILLATIVGAFSPFCSCGVIPVIASLLIGGVPLAPIMSFWIASPSMDPEIFFLSVSIIGWKLAVWRLLSTFIISLLAGFITHLLVKRGWVKDYIRNAETKAIRNIWQILFQKIKKLKKWFVVEENTILAMKLIPVSKSVKSAREGQQCCISIKIEEDIEESKSCSCNDTACSVQEKSIPKWKEIFRESYAAFMIVAKFMALAFLINALIHLYIPEDFIAGILNNSGFVSVLIASVLGVPVYTSNLTALPLISGLLNLGLNPAAALAFLISGPVTTLPAMVAVFGITKRKVFILYILYAFVGAILFGMLYYLVN